jgi:hypothetical protein
MSRCSPLPATGAVAWSAAFMAIALLALAAPASAAPPAPAQNPVAGADTSNGCLACHAAQRQAAVEGVHAQHGVTCVTCHGGDASATSLPAAHTGHYIGSPDKVATAELCGSCHSDPNRMREYGLPTGQLAQFRTSKHGQLLFGQQNDDAPTCTDCHGAHIIYPPYDARSRVYPTNIPGTCAHCHSNEQLMAKYHLRTDQFTEFRQSAHGVALFQHQNFAAPTCVSCHGAHSALPPTVTEIANVCGRCHVLVDQQFSIGPHGAAARAGKLRGCLGCHSNHGTERVAADSISATCDRCHAADTRLHQMGIDLQHRVMQSTADIESAQRSVEQLALAGERVGDYRFRYQSALTFYLQIAQKQHSLDLDTLEELGRRVRSVSVALDAASAASSEHRWEHKLLLMPVWFLTLSAVALAFLALRALRRVDGDTKQPEP